MISFSFLLLVVTLVAIAGAIVGVSISGIPDLARRIIPLSGAFLLVLSLAGILPELADRYGWPAGPAFMLGGTVAIWAIDRYIFPVCPACSHTHDHDACSTRLHGFALPLVLAAALHNLVDGWTLAAANGSGMLTAGILVHKLPESVALGVILRAALSSRRLAATWASTTQLVTPAAALAGIFAAPYMGTNWTGVPLALGGGAFIYLGFHAVHGEWKRRTAARAIRIG